MTPPHRIGRRATAAAVLVLAWLPAAVSALMVIALRPEPAVVPRSYVAVLAIAVIYGAVSSVILARSIHAVGVILAFLSVGCGFTALAIVYRLAGAASPDLPALALAPYVERWGPIAVVPALTVMPWLFTRRRHTAVWRIGLGAGVVVSSLDVALRAILPVVADGPIPVPRDLRGDLIRAIDATAIVGSVAIFLAASIYLAATWRHDPPHLRRGLPWLGFGCLLLIVAYMTHFTQLDDSHDGLYTILAAASAVLAHTVLAAAIVVTILGRRMIGIDLALSRILVRALMVGLTVAGFLLVVLVLAASGIDLLVAGTVAVVVIALMFQPLQTWTHRRVDALVFGAAAEPSRLVRAIGDQLGTREGAARIEGLLVALRQSLRLGSLELRDTADDGRSGAGPFHEPSLAIELRIGRDRIGWLVAGSATGEPLLPPTERALRDVAGVLAVAVQLVRLNHEVREARDRVVEVRHEERRMLRRELHDGLGPSLAGIALGLGALRNMDSERNSHGIELLDRLQSELSTRIEDVRSLARTLLPPALDEGRLEDALADLAERLSDGRTRFEADVQGGDGLDTARQVAIYHIAAEAMLNARRHSGASIVRVSLRSDADEAVLEVADDGNGMPEGHAPGVGLTSMRERAEEVGGVFDVSHGDGGRGTTVRVTLR